MNNLQRVAAICLLAALAACQNESLAPLIASDVEITPPLPVNSLSAAYLSLQNTTEQAIIISAVTSTEYDSVEIHESSIKDGIARMRKLTSLSIPAGTTIYLQRGGIHLMLQQPRDVADTVSLTFLSGTTPVLNITASISQRSN